MDLIKITPDKERAKNILSMISLIEERIKLQDENKMSALILVDYYEIIKELITAVLFTDGYKTLSHKDLIDYLKDNYKVFSSHEIYVLDNLRVLRNRVAYGGFQVEKSYLDRNKDFFKSVILKLRKILGEKGVSK